MSGTPCKVCEARRCRPCGVGGRPKTSSNLVERCGLNEAPQAADYSSTPIAPAPTTATLTSPILKRDSPSLLREAARGRQGDAARAGYRALGAAFGGCLRWLAARVRPSLLVSRNCIPRAGRIRRNVRARPRERVHRVVSSRPAVRVDTPRAPTGLARTRRATERRLLRCVTGAADAPEGRW